MTNIGIPLLLFLAALAVGGLVGVALHRYLLRGRERLLQARFDTERAQWESARSDLSGRLALTRGELNAELRAHESTRHDLEAERRQNGQLDKTVRPMQVALTELERRIGEAESARQRAQVELREHLTQMKQTFGEATAGVKQEARRLSQALTRSERRGSWGEMQLKRLVEVSGMINRVHFVEQDHTNAEDGTLRPDMVIDLAGGRKVVVDSKVPLDAFLALEQDPDDESMLAKHADAVAGHVDRLARKEYWKRYDSPEFVVMFLPAEALLGAALQTRPELLQHAFAKRVVLATPTTLMATLHTIGFAWQQADVAARAKEIQGLGADLYQRLSKMAENLDGLGKAIGKSVTQYNLTVGSLESRVLPTARKFQALSPSTKDLVDLTTVDETVRSLSATELIADTGETPQLRTA